MSKNKEQMLSVAEVFEMTPGDENTVTWINPGFIATVAKIEHTKIKNSGKAMHICTLRDQTGSAEISMTLFTPTIAFDEGAVIEVSGQGLRRTEFNKLAQVSVSQKTEIHVLGQSTHYDEQQERKAESKPAINGKQFPVNGQTVGMAMKETLALLTRGFNREELITWLLNPMSWASVHEVSSDIIRTARLLELGKLAPSIRERVGGPSAARKEPVQVPTQQRSAPRTAPTDEKLANRDPSSSEEDVPF